MDPIDRETAKWINSVPFDPDVHDWITKNATLQGFFPNQFVGWLIGTFYQGWQPPLEDEKATIDQKVYWIFKIAQRDHQKHQNLRRLACIVAEHETEQNVEMLQEYCDLLNEPYEAILDQARSDMFSALAKYENATTKMGKCIRWLADRMQENNEVPTTTIRTNGEDAGFSWSMMQRAKAKISLDRDTPNIVSEKRGPIWWWVLKEEEQQEHHPPIS